jgi:PAS domain S-box-containing protein
VEQSPASIVITDTAGRIKYVNPKFCQVTGYLPEEVAGQSVSSLRFGEAPPEEYKHLWATILSGSEWRGELPNWRKNGELFWEHVAISSIKDDGGHSPTKCASATASPNGRRRVPPASGG